MAVRMIVSKMQREWHDVVSKFTPGSITRTPARVTIFYDPRTTAGLGEIYWTSDMVPPPGAVAVARKQGKTCVVEATWAPGAGFGDRYTYRTGRFP